MAGAVTDFYGTATVTPGDGRPRELGRILDRNDNLYMNNGYLRLSNNTRVDLRTIIENPPGSGTPNVVTSANALPDNFLVMGDGVRTIQTTTLASTGANLTVPNAFSAGDGNDAISLNGVNWPIAAPSAGNILTATNGTTTAWSAPTAVAVTTVASGGGSGDSLVIAGGPGAVTLKDIAGGTGITVTNDADDIIISLTGGAGVTGTGTNNFLALWNGTTALDASAISEPTAGNLVSINTANSATPSNLSSVNSTSVFVAGNTFASTMNAGGLGNSSMLIAGNNITAASTINSNCSSVAITACSGAVKTVSSSTAIAATACNGTIEFGSGNMRFFAASSDCAMDSGATRNRAIIASRAVLVPSNEHTLTMGYANSTTAATANRTIEFDAEAGTGIAEAGFSTAVLSDIAEYFENATNQIVPEGTVMTLAFDGTRKCKPAQPGDRIIGVVSATAGIRMNDAPFAWSGRYKKSKVGKYVYEMQPDKAWKPEKGQTEADRPLIRAKKESESYNPDLPYVPRSERPAEWSLIATYKGAQVYVRVEPGTPVAAGDYLAVNKDGVCVKSLTPTLFQVMEVTNVDLVWCYYG